MTTTVTLEQAQTDLKELISSLETNDHIVITENNRPIAELRAPEPQVKRPQPGICAGMVVSYIDDDEHLKDFEEYMR